MQALALICPLEIPPDDRGRIEAIRKRHDPQFGRVEPHFTLVFPVQGATEAVMTRQAEAVAAATPAIGFTLNDARVAPDALIARSHIFLMPDEGEAAIRALHDELYQGELAPGLRADIPYQPHVTVGAFDRLADAEAALAEIGSLAISGCLRSLQLISIEGGVLRPLRGFPFRTAR